LHQPFRPDMLQSDRLATAEDALSRHYMAPAVTTTGAPFVMITVCS